MPGKQTTKLTGAQKDAFEFILRSIQTTGHGPTFPQLAQGLGISVPSVQDRVKALIAKGYVEKTFGGPRGFRILRYCDAMGNPTDIPVPKSPLPPEPRRPSKRQPKLISIPLYGTVVAGDPFSTDITVEGEVFVDSSIADKETCYAVRVCGESMIDMGINSGDILVVRYQRFANDGDVVIASVNGEMTVKTLDFKKGKVALVPANKDFHPIEIGPEDDFRVMGLVLNDINNS